MVLQEFPVDKAISGLGMSDWEGYSKGLVQRLAYTNIYCHTEPRLDITNVPEEATAKHRFLISSDIFEHIPIFALEMIFHGGSGMNLEMRMFSEPDLRRRLARAGFPSIRIYADHVPEFGILWPMDWAVPVAARCAG